MANSSEDIADRATNLQHLATANPSAVPLEQVHEIISTPTVSPGTYGAAIIALLHVPRDRDDVGGEFADGNIIIFH